jgi:hypothetical protein
VIARRSFLAGILAACAAPALARQGMLMPVRAPVWRPLDGVLTPIDRWSLAVSARLPDELTYYRNDTPHTIIISPAARALWADVKASGQYNIVEQDHLPRSSFVRTTNLRRQHAR